MDHSNKTEENRLRRLLARTGHCLQKTPSRSWLREHYGVGYMVTRDNVVRLGCLHHAYNANLQDVAKFASSQPLPSTNSRRS